MVGVETLTVEGVSSDFYRIHLPDGSQSWIPLGRLKAQGLRPVMSPKTAKATLKAAREEEAPGKRATWNRRQKRYRETLLENEPKAIGAMLGELGSVLREKGQLSFSERRIFEQALGQLSAELSLSLELTQDQARERIEKALGASL